MKTFEEYMEAVKDITIVEPDINNGAIVNKIFQSFNNVKNEKQLIAVEKKVFDLKFNILELIDKWDKGNANSVVRKDFLDFIDKTLKIKHYDKWKE